MLTAYVQRATRLANRFEAPTLKAQHDGRLENCQALPGGDHDAQPARLQLVAHAVLQRLGLGEAAHEEDEIHCIFRHRTRGRLPWLL